MEILLEFVLQILGELLFQLGFEMLAELGFRGLQEPFRRPKPLHPILAGICYLIFGAVAGLLSLLLLPHLMIDSAVGRVANLVVTPQWERHLHRVLDAYVDAADRENEQGIGIWISGRLRGGAKAATSFGELRDY